MAANGAIRLRSISNWSRCVKGHSSILKEFELIPRVTHHTLIKFSFENDFHVCFPSRDDWEKGKVVDNDTIQFFTDGKLLGRVGSGVFSHQLDINLAFRLPDYCSVFQAKVIAISEVMDWLRYNTISSRDIVIFTDSQAAIKTLKAPFGTSKVVLDCQSSLREMAEQFNIKLI